MYGKELDFVDSYKYLGVTVTAGPLICFSNYNPLVKFKRSVNSIVNVNMQPSEPVLLQLLYTMCVPILTYACEAINYSTAQMHSLNVALNDSIRSIFTYNRWESVRYLRISFGYPSFTDIFQKRTALFLKQIPLTQNNVLQFLAALLVES